MSEAQGAPGRTAQRAVRRRLADLPVEAMAGGVARRRFTGDALELIRYDYPAGARFATHDHDAEQMTIVLEGTLVFTLPQGEERLRAGDALLIPGGVPHGAYVPGSAGTDPPTITLNLFTPVRSNLPSGG
jgi:quercetin dioxygenase-like cupin family protein